MLFWRAFTLCAIMGLLVGHGSGCAYRLQGAHNPLKELGIERIYVEGFRNSTYRPGIEHLFTTAMIREIGRAKAFKLVNSAKEADAVLSGTITGADSSPGSTKQVTVDRRAVGVAVEYNASVVCAVELRDRRNKIVFSQSVTASKIHPGSAQLGDAGATAPLINDSEQRLAIHFLASQMMASVYQRMIDTF